MKKSKLISVLRVLESDDLRQIQKLLKSPFFTSNKNLLKLFQTIRRYHPDYSSAALEKEKLYAKVFPKTDYSDVKFRNLMGELSQLIEEYLIIHFIRTDTYIQKRYLSIAYANRAELKFSRKESEAVKEKVLNSAFQDIDYYQGLFQWADDRLKNTRADDITDRLQLLQEKDKYLELYYQLSKIQLESELRSSKNIMSIGEADIKEWATSHLKEENLVYQCYEKAIQLHDGKEEAVFLELKELVVGSIEKIPPSSQEEFLLHLINFAIGQMKEDDIKFNTIVLELYIFGLEHGIFLQNDMIRDADFFNIVVASAKEKRTDWSEQFIKKYASRLSLNEKKDTMAISQIYLFYYQEKFSEAINLINQHNFTDPQKHIAARTQAIRCYFELFILDHTYYNLVIDQTLAYEKFIRRNQTIGESYQKAIYHFLQVIRKIANERIKGSLQPETIKKLLGLLESQEITLSRSWLIEKIKN